MAQALHISHRTTDLDDLDHRLIQLTQCGLPLVPRPYHALADQLGVSAREVQARFKSMLDNGIVRRIGAVPNHYRLGYTANGMSVWDVPDHAVEELGPRVGALPFVSHCYQRPRHMPLWPYNLFAMVHGRDRDETDRKVKQIAEVLGSEVRSYTVLYSTRILKKTGLRI